MKKAGHKPSKIKLPSNPAITVPNHGFIYLLYGEVRRFLSKCRICWHEGQIKSPA
jgi:hypothetical protein